MLESLINKNPKKALFVGRILSILVIVFLLLDSIIHILNIFPVAKASIQLGLPVW